MSREQELTMYRFLLGAVGLYAVWTLTTYVLEGRSLTLLRPQATGARLTYALVANILVGVVGAGLVLRAAVRHAGIDPRRLALRAPGRTALGLALGLALGGGAFVLQQPVTLAPAVIGHAFAQVWVVSVAEVLVCWAVLGKAVEVEVSPGRVGPDGARGLRLLLACMVSAVAFGVYHVAHSPPFNTVGMVGLLTAVGLATGAFFFLVGELYGTIVFHNFMALKGVTDALAEGGRLDHFQSPQPALIGTALIATGVLVAVDRLVRRASAATTSGSS